MNKLKTSQKLAFATADLFGGGSFNVINFLYPGFLALTVGLSPYMISIVMLVARIWDAISDPLMGRISDATRSPFGKRRIYLLIASPLVLISFFLLFFPFAFSSTTLRFIAVLVSYILFCTVQTMVMIPYYSLSSEISSDYQNRASANSYRLGFSIFSSLLCVALPPMIVQKYDSSTGYIVMSVTFGVLFAISVFITGFFVREEIKTEPIHTKFSYRFFINLVKIKPFRYYLTMFLAVQMSMCILSAFFFFLIDFFIRRDVTALGQSNMLGLISAALMFSMQIVALPIYLSLIKKTSKASVYRIGAYIWLACSIAIFTLQPGAPDIHLLVLAIIMGVGISAPGLVPHTMFGDIADVVELISGKRSEGLISGWVNLFNKIAQAVALAIAMAAIGYFGFQEAIPGGPAITRQPVSAQLAIRNIMAITPILFLGIGIAISFLYKIDAKKQASIHAALQTGENRDQLVKEFSQDAFSKN